MDDDIAAQVHCRQFEHRRIGLTGLRVEDFPGDVLVILIRLGVGPRALAWTKAQRALLGMNHLAAGMNVHVQAHHCRLGAVIADVYQDLQLADVKVGRPRFFVEQAHGARGSDPEVIDLLGAGLTGAVIS